jgi:alkylation response protein AidB-like acyl-CoA dehydrogenase
MRNADEILAAVQQLAPIIEAEKRAFDRDRQLPEHVVSAMHEVGLFHLWLPRELGGPALNLRDAARVLEAVAQIDGAPSWCACIATTYSRLGAFLPRHVASKIFVEDRAIVGGTFVCGRADVVEGGYRLTGRMPYSSGIRHCHWAVGGGSVFKDGIPRMMANGAQETRTMLYPSSQIEVLDTWDVGGLRGTGSHDCVVNNLFVPDEQTVLEHGQSTDCAGGFYRIPPYTTYPVSIAAVLLGIARNALNLFYGLATAKVPRSGSRRVCEDESVQTAIGRAEGALRSARAFLFEITEELDSASEAGDKISIKQRMMLRLACAQVAAAAKETVQIVYDAAGGSSVYEANGIQRCFRDLYAATQHVQVQTVNFKWVGQVAMGLEPSTSRF